MKTGRVCVLAAALIGMALAARASGDNWLTNFEAAKKLAAEKGRPILADFSGSDWCGWCIKLDQEVFSQAEFQAYATNNLVLFLADFPARKPQADDVKQQNAGLQQKYNIQGYPTVLLLDAEGKVLAQTGYQQGGAAAYVEHVKKLLAKKE
jgi:protein disulfide-isomerase